MLGTLEIVIIAAAASLGFLLVSIFSVFLGLRARDKRLTEAQTTRNFVQGQRVDVRHSNSKCSHIPQPKEKLRRSAHLPYGIVSESWAAIPSHESFDPPPISEPESCSRGRGLEISPKRRRSIRASFSAHSFSIPKTRRQKKIENAVPLRALPHSPLSAITEKSGTNTASASPSVGIAELPTEVTPRTTPERDVDILPNPRPSSLQWPLPPTNGRDCVALPAPIPTPVGQKRDINRIGSVDRNVALARKSFIPRSLSASSTLSTAPEDPLPPLPSIVPSQWDTGRRSRLRLSASSVDTIGSSLLGEGRMSPSHTNSELPSPLFDPIPRGLLEHNREDRSQEIAARITTGSPNIRPRAEHKAGLPRQVHCRTTRVGDLRSVHDGDSPHHQSLIPRLIESSGASLDTSDCRSSLTSHPASRSSIMSASLPCNIIRTTTGCMKGTVASRHSMYEQCSTDGRASTDSVALGDEPGGQADPLRLSAISRPVSVTTASPHRWDGSLARGGSSPVADIYSTSPPREHEEQCHTRSPRKQNDPKMANGLLRAIKGGSDGIHSIPGQTGAIPGLNLIEREKKRISATHVQEEKRSILDTRPILKPTSGRQMERGEGRKGSSESSGARDLDVFRNPRYDPKAPNIFKQSPEPQQPWPLRPSSTEQVQLQATPPRLKAIREPFDPDSPTLPPPILSSATIFAHALPLGTRTSAIQGPRSLPGSDRASRGASPSPTRARTAMRGEDLRRSVMRLKRVPSDAKERMRMSQLFRDMEGETMSNLIHESHSDDDDENTGPSQPTVSIVDLSLINNQAAHEPNTYHATHPHRSPSTSPSRSRNLAGGGLRLSKSIRSNKTPTRSPSSTSISATSIWEDASVRDSSPEPELPPSSKFLVPSPRTQNRQQQQQQRQPKLVEGRENTNENLDVVAPDEVSVEDRKRKQQRDTPASSQKARDRDQDRDRESKLTSPQGKGLGLFDVGVPVQDDKQPHRNKCVRAAATGSLYDVDGFLRE